MGRSRRLWHSPHWTQLVSGDKYRMQTMAPEANKTACRVRPEAFHAVFEAPASLPASPLALLLSKTLKSFMTTFRSAATTFQTKTQVRPGFRIYFDFIFNVSTDPALMEAAAPDPTVGLV